jgi:hypothetical protein
MTAGTASSPQEPASQPFLIALVIDKSGSMEPLVEQTVAGFNEFLADQRANAPEALMHVTLFDDTRTFLHVARPVGDVPPLTAAVYRGEGMNTTALNDAVGETIARIAASAEAPGRKVLVVVITDGLENASTDFTTAQIKTLVSMKEREDDWKFVFFGANIDAFAEGTARGIAPMRSVDYHATPEDTRSSYRRISRATSLYRDGANEAVWASALREEVRSVAEPPQPPAKKRPAKDTLAGAVDAAIRRPRKPKRGS